jgi:hypothetical protein
MERLLAASEDGSLMASYLIHLMGQREPAHIDLPFDDMDDLAAEAARAKFLIGHMTNADEDGVCRRVLIAANRIECVVET